MRAQCQLRTKMLCTLYLAFRRYLIDNRFTISYYQSDYVFLSLQFISSRTFHPVQCLSMAKNEYINFKKYTPNNQFDIYRKSDKDVFVHSDCLILHISLKFHKLFSLSKKLKTYLVLCADR